MKIVDEATIRAWQRDPGQWREYPAGEDVWFEWDGGELIVMTIELVEQLNRERQWGRLPWRFERLGMVPGEASIMYRKVEGAGA